MLFPLDRRPSDIYGQFMKWIFRIIAVAIIVPVLAVVGWWQWSKTLPRPPLVNCDHVPYLRAQISDTLLTIPRKYAKRSTPIKGDGTSGDFYGRCQNKDDPPVHLQSMTISSKLNVKDLKYNNITIYIPNTIMSFYNLNQKNEFYAIKKGVFNMNIGKNSSFSIGVDKKYYKKEGKDFHKKLKVLLWALTQPPDAGLITPDGDFNLEKLRQKERE
jgi:hypothetical protein